MDRLYVNANALGLHCSYYNTGNISSASINGKSISNCEARRMKASKTYIDVKTGEVISDNKMLKDAATEILESID